MGGADVHVVHRSARIGIVIRQRLYRQIGCATVFFDLCGGAIDGTVDYCRPLRFVGCASRLAPFSLIQLQKEIHMLTRLFAFFLYVLCWAQPLYGASPKEDALQIEIPLVQGAEKYLDLVEYPAYLVVALENNGIKASNKNRTQKR